MRVGGVLLLVFLVFHLLQLTVGTIHPQFTHLDPYNNVRIALSNPAVAIFYLAAMAALACSKPNANPPVRRAVGPPSC